MDDSEGAERRIIPRHPGDTINAVIIRVGACGLTLPASVSNISVEGIGLIAETALEPAGPIQIDWTHSSPGRGWIYYQPEVVRVEIGTAEDFDKIDLRRFLRKK